jgi:hypothetical protein
MPATTITQTLSPFLHLTIYKASEDTTSYEFLKMGRKLNRKRRTLHNGPENSQQCHIEFYLKL